MHDSQVNARKRRGQETAARSDIVRKDGHWLVPSTNSRRKRYKVDINPSRPSCTCADHREHGAKCKHIYAVEHLIQSGSNQAAGLASPDQKLLPRKPTFRRDWATYNLTQTNEEDEFEPLLYELCRSIIQPEHSRGRCPVSLSDAVFSCVSKVYLLKSARRVMPRLRLAYERGYLDKPIIFNTISAYLEKEELTPILHDLIIRSSLPVSPIERVFAIDSTGFVGSRFIRWQDIKYRGMHEHVWAKMHIICGVETHIVTACVVAERDAADLEQLPNLLRTTAQNFLIREVLADRVYNTVKNQQEIAAVGARAYIPFKSTHTGRRGGIWKEKFIEWNENPETSLNHYHMRSNVETVFSMIKGKFSDSLRSKHEIPMRNEALCKVICHNLYCLIRLMYDLGIGADFLAKSFQKGAAHQQDAAD
jgi:transposase